MKHKILFFEINDFEKKNISSQIKNKGLKVDYELCQQELSEQNVNKIARADIISVFIYSKLDSNLIKILSKKGVKLIATRSTGFNHIDLEECKKRGIYVVNVPCYGATTVAEHTFALILSISRKILDATSRTKRGDFSINGLRGFDLEGKTIGVVGTGRIGREVIRIAKGFNMKILCYDKFQNEDVKKVADYVSLNKLLSNSDIITLHLPLLKSTRHIINFKNISEIKKGAVLINTARGELVETEALIKALDSGIIKYAGLDVLEAENIFKNSVEADEAPKSKLKTAVKNLEFLKRENVILTPHNAFNTEEAALRIIETTLDNIKSFLEGNVKNAVN